MARERILLVSKSSAVFFSLSREAVTFMGTCDCTSWWDQRQPEIGIRLSMGRTGLGWKWPWNGLAIGWAGLGRDWQWVGLTMGWSILAPPPTLGIDVMGGPEQSQDQLPFSVQMVPPKAIRVVHLESIQKISSPSLERNLLYRLFSYSTSTVTSLLPADTQPHLLPWQ